jgi:hypothetical protein
MIDILRASDPTARGISLTANRSDIQNMKSPQLTVMPKKMLFLQPPALFFGDFGLCLVQSLPHETAGLLKFLNFMIL